jgi:uncharacterized protein YdaU (DUF1376 family)
VTTNKDVAPNGFEGKHDTYEPEDSRGDHTPFLQFYTSDWTAGTIGFTLEQRGFYFEALKMMWELKSGLPDDIKWLGCALRCDPRTARRLRSFLINKGKLVPVDGLLINKRMARDIAARKRKLRANFGEPSGELQPKLDLIFSKNPIDSKVVPFSGPHIRIHNPESIKEDRSFSAVEDDAGAATRTASPSPPHRPSRYHDISDKALDHVGTIAPGWDRQALKHKFLTWPGSRNAENLDKAFIGWVPSFIKGKKP